MKQVINVFFAFDCFMFSLLTLGKAYPYESFSSAAWRAQLNGRVYGKARPLIDSLLGKDHCERAYNQARLNLPEDQR